MNNTNNLNIIYIKFVFTSPTELQKEAAELFGMEDTLFVPTGTMGNLIAGMTVCTVMPRAINKSCLHLCLGVEVNTRDAILLSLVYTALPLGIKKKTFLFWMVYEWLKCSWNFVVVFNQIYIHCRAELLFPTCFALLRLFFFVCVSLSVMVHCRERGDEMLLGDLSHIYIYEQGGSAQV